MKPIQVIDHLVSKHAFELTFDSKTGAWKTMPQPKEEALEKYYPNSGYASHQRKPKDFQSALYFCIKAVNNYVKLKRLNSVCPKGKLLDFGAGNGAFAQQAKKQGWEVYAYEKAQNAISQIKQKKIILCNQPYRPNSFNAITLWHVFEHLPNPKQELANFYHALIPGGVLILALPNIDAWDARHYKSLWAAYDAPRHLWHYNKTAIEQLAKDSGFTVIKTQNMFWDAYYVSLLSEQYGHSKFQWIKALLKGTYSNLVGWRIKNTSSLTFILKKPE